MSNWRRQNAFWYGCIPFALVCAFAGGYLLPKGHEPLLLMFSLLVGLVGGLLLRLIARMLGVASEADVTPSKN